MGKSIRPKAIRLCKGGYSGLSRPLGLLSACSVALAAATMPGKAALAEPTVPKSAKTNAKSPKVKAATDPAAAAPSSTAHPLIPKPDSPSQAELEHIRRLDAAIAPIRDYTLDGADAARIRDAIKAVAAKDLDKATEIKRAIEDPIGRKLVDWYRLRNGLGEPAEYRAFLDANPSWPDRTGLTQKLEETLFTSGGSASTIKAQFAGRPPQNGRRLRRDGIGLSRRGQRGRGQAHRRQDLARAEPPTASSSPASWPASANI